MKTHAWYLLVLVVGTLVVQGCAQTGDVKAGPVTAAAPVVVALTAPPQSAVLPKYKKGEPVVKADTKENFEAVAAAIQQQMQPGGRWQFVDGNERNLVDGSFVDMRNLYNKFGSVDKMDQAAKIRLLADQSTVNAILTKRDGERLICQSQMPVGSHIPVRTCRTYAQIQTEQRQTQQSLMRINQQANYQRVGGH